MSQSTDHNMICSQLILSLQFLVISIPGEKIDDPTLKPDPGFYGRGLGEIFKEEFDDAQSTNRENVAIRWFRRTWEERMSAKSAYEGEFCPHMYWDNYCPLSSAFNLVSTGCLKKLYESSLAPPDGILARTAHNDMDGKLDELGAIEEVVCANDPPMKQKIKTFYEMEYKKSIEEDLANFRKKDEVYTRALTIHCWKGLCQEKKIKPEDAEKEAKALRNINPECDGDAFKKKLTELLDKNCEPDLKLIFQKYRNEKDGINDAVNKAFDVERQQRIFDVLVRYIEDTCKFYADMLDNGLSGVGVKNTKVNRIILTRCERDLACILRKYNEIYGEDFLKKLKAQSFGEGRYYKAITCLSGKCNKDD